MDSVKKYKEMWVKSDTTCKITTDERIDELLKKNGDGSYVKKNQFFDSIKLNHEPNPRKNYPMYSGLLKYFPNALKYVSHVSLVANNQHHPDEPLHWDKNKSTDEPDALMRHLADHSIEPVDDDGLLHIGKVAWRALAMLERFLEEDERRS